MNNSGKRQTVLALLAAHPEGLFGSDLIHLSEGRVSRFSVYHVLRDLVDEGLVHETEVPGATPTLPRTRHTLTPKGKAAATPQGEPA